MSASPRIVSSLVADIIPCRPFIPLARPVACERLFEPRIFEQNHGQPLAVTIPSGSREPVPIVGQLRRGGSSGSCYLDDTPSDLSWLATSIGRLARRSSKNWSHSF